MVVATKQLHDWFETDAGQRVLGCERDHLLPMVANYRPFRSLDMTRGLLLQDSLSKQVVALTAEPSICCDNSFAQVVSDYGRLPFASESFDLVVCAHLHELSSSAGEMVADMSRVLTPGGLCVFLALILMVCGGALIMAISIGGHVQRCHLICKRLEICFFLKLCFVIISALVG